MTISDNFCKCLTISVNMFLYFFFSYMVRQWWRDPRLANNKTDDTMTYDHDVDIWLPHLSVMNSDEDFIVDDRRLKVDIDSKGTFSCPPISSVKKKSIYIFSWRKFWLV